MIPHFKRRTIEQTRDVLRNALAYALDIDEIVGSNAARKVELPASQDKPVESYDPQEVHKLRRVLEGHRYEVLFTTSILTGLRISEVLGLQWPDIDFEEKRITAKRSLSKPRGGDWRFGDTKTHRIRTVDMAQPLVDALVKHREVQGLERLSNAAHFKNTFNLVFTTELGTPIDRHNLSREWRKIVEQAGVRYLGIHKLRATNASLIQHVGGSLHDASQVLGHSSIGITARLYSHLFPQDRRDLMEKIGEAATPKPIA
jgi:integrase